MSYIPHAALGAVKFLNGSIERAEVRLTQNPKSGGGKYQVYCTVTVFGLPGSRRLSAVRYFGPLNISAKGETQVSAPGFYDESINWALENGGVLTDIFTQMTGQLQGRAVTVQNIGGRWLIR